ncbi:VanW family protein [Corynebacterium kroppenstedtii]
MSENNRTHGSIGSGRKRHTASWWSLGFLLFLFVMAGIAYATDLVMSQGQVPRGVTVGGVNIGGMTKASADTTLRNQLGDKVREPVSIHAGDMTSSLDPTMSGLRVDWDETVKKAGQQPKNPWTRIESFWKNREVGIVNDVDQGALNNALQRVDKELTRAPANAELAIGIDGKAAVKNAVAGQSVNHDVLADNVSRRWLNTNRVVDIPATHLQPAVGEDAVKRAERDILNKVVSGPLTFNGRDNTSGIINPEDMGKIVTFRVDGAHFTADYDTNAAQSILSWQLESTERQKKDAGIHIGDDGSVSVTSPSEDGVSIDWSHTLDDLQGKLTNTTVRHYDVVYSDEPATFTTDMAHRADFRQTMGEFTTGGYAAESGVNIRRVAEMVNGAIIAPGQTFSLNGYTGPRGEAQGFVKAGIIKNGHSDEGVGGGISQFATTLYNATYFAGMTDVSHTPHSFYISRYPPGREATVYEGAIDLKFKNPFDTPVLITALTGDHDVTVKIKGIPHVKVDSIEGPKTNFTDPPTQQLRGPQCHPSSGSRGFTVTDTRVVTSLATGQEISRNTTTTKYDPSPKITCG